MNPFATGLVYQTSLSDRDFNPGLSGLGVRRAESAGLHK
jgi:hypothetical protein